MSLAALGTSSGFLASAHGATTTGHQGATSPFKCLHLPSSVFFFLIGGYLFYNPVMALPYSSMIQPQAHTCPLPLKPSSPLHPSRSSQSTGFGFPASYSKFPLAIYSTYGQPWVFIGSTDAEAEAPIVWQPDAKSRLTGKDLDAGKDWGQEEREATEGKIDGWHHQLDGHEFGQTPRDGEGQGSLAWCSPRDHKELDTTEKPNNTYFNTVLSSHPSLSLPVWNQKSVFMSVSPLLPANRIIRTIFL